MQEILRGFISAEIAELSRAFESVLGSLMDRILQNLNASRSLTTQRDALLSGLVSGEVGVEGGTAGEIETLSNV